MAHQPILGDVDMTTMTTEISNLVRDILRSGRVPNANDMDLWQHLDAARQNLEEAVRLANAHLKDSSLTSVVSEHAMIGQHQPDGQFPTIIVQEDGEIALVLVDRKARKSRKAASNKTASPKKSAAKTKKAAAKAATPKAAKAATSDKRAYTSSLPKLDALRERAAKLNVNIDSLGRQRSTIVKVLDEYETNGVSPTHAKHIKHDDVEAHGFTNTPEGLMPSKTPPVLEAAPEPTPEPVVVAEDSNSTTTLVSPGVKRKRMKKGDAVQATPFPPETDLGDLFTADEETPSNGNGNGAAKEEPKTSVADVVKGAGDIDLDKLLNI